MRNHIPQMLNTIVADLRDSQSESASVAKSRGITAEAHVYTEADGHANMKADCARLNTAVR